MSQNPKEIKISATSALVLNWTSRDVWKTSVALKYFDGLDLSEGDSLLQAFGPDERLIHRETISNRKFFMRASALQFLENHPTGQVVIVAAGIAPLSAEIANLYPTAMVFDLDKYHMEEKAASLGFLCPNIRFISCDITDIISMETKLTENGWKGSEPSLLVMEGITYYLKETELRGILAFFGRFNTGLVCDIGLKPQCVDLPHRAHGSQLGEKIRTMLGMDSMTTFELEYFFHLVEECGFKNPLSTKMATVQKARTGDEKPFENSAITTLTLVEASTGMLQ